MVKKDPIFYGIKGDYLLWIKRKGSVKNFV